MNGLANRLELVVERAPGRLVRLSDPDLSRRSAAGRWSKKEILGHLIDSAANNHQRFVRAQLAPSLEFPNYQQEGWVSSQSYQSEPWPDLVNLWLLLNRHLVHVVRVMPPESLSRPCSIGGKPPVPLSEVMEGYLQHLEHHLTQIFGEP